MRIHSTQEEPVLMELWLRAVAAYECNDLKDLTECEALVNRAVREPGIEPLDMEIPDIEEKSWNARNAGLRSN